MSKISKALDKYKKEHNLSSAQIFNLEDAKLPGSALNEGKDRFARKGVGAEAAKQSVQPHPPQKESSASTETASRETVHHPDDHPEMEGTVSEPQRKPHFVLADRQAEKTVSQEIKNKEKTPHREDEAAVSSEPGSLGRIDPNLVSIVNPGCIESEIFKVLRAKILFPTAGSPPKSILVTSAAPGEGKSFTASNLAVNLAQNIENHVLLMDCDLRRPTIHKLFGFGTVEGLSENLSNGNRLSSLFLKTGIGKLTVLPSGKPPANPSELLSSEKMAGLIEELKNRYDDRFLIIDSPPPIVAPETTALAKLVDGIILVIKSGSTPLHLVEELIDTLGRKKILGAVINRYDSRISFGSYGYKKYSKYYRSKP